MLTNIDIRKLRCLDGLHYSFELIDYYYSSLYGTCCEIPDNKSTVTKALSACWGFIDVLHRIREIAQSVPSLSVKHQEMRAFLSSTSLAENYRHYIQHLRNEITNDPPNTFPVWGALSWVDKDNSKRSNIAIFGSQIEDTHYSVCVYDTANKKWVSKVCLGVGNRSFNFDPIYQACIRFKEFILPYLIEGVPEEVRFHNNNMLVLSMDMEVKENA